MSPVRMACPAVDGLTAQRLRYNLIAAFKQTLIEKILASQEFAMNVSLPASSQHHSFHSSAGGDMATLNQPPGGATLDGGDQDWYEAALTVDAPIRGPVAAWSEDEEEESSDDTDEADPDADLDTDIQTDPFDDFDPNDFDDEFDDDFEEELEDEYEIEPEDDEVLKELGSPQIKVSDGTADEEEEEEDISIDEDDD